jgi:hypothetical protein
MRQDEVRQGLLVRLLTDYANVPASTWAMVDSAGRMHDGAWWFTVRWRPYTPIPHKFPREATEYSTNLWEADLTLFETVSAEDEAAAKRKQLEAPFPLASYPKLAGGWQASRRSRVDPNQLRLFLADDFE